MPRLLPLFIAALLLSCKPPPPKVTSDFSGWPIDMNNLIRSIQASTGCKIGIKEELKLTTSPATPSGCILFVQSRSEDRHRKALDSAFSAISDGLKAKGCKIASTEPTSCKADYRFVYAGTSTHGSITLMGLTEKEGVQLVIHLLEDDDTLKKTANTTDQPLPSPAQK